MEVQFFLHQSAEAQATFPKGRIETAQGLAAQGSEQPGLGEDVPPAHGRVLE